MQNWQFKTNNNIEILYKNSKETKCEMQICTNFACHWDVSKKYEKIRCSKVITTNQHSNFEKKNTKDFRTTTGYLYLFFEQYSRSETNNSKFFIKTNI